MFYRIMTGHPHAADAAADELVDNIMMESAIAAATTVPAAPADSEWKELALAELDSVRASQSMQRICCTQQHDGPDHLLGFVVQMQEMPPKRRPSAAADWKQKAVPPEWDSGREPRDQPSRSREAPVPTLKGSGRTRTGSERRRKGCLAATPCHIWLTLPWVGCSEGQGTALDRQWKLGQPTYG